MQAADLPRGRTGSSSENSAEHGPRPMLNGILFNQLLGARNSMDDKESLWNMLKEEYTHARQHQTQRATMTTIVIVVASALTGLITFDDSIGQGDIAPSIVVIALGTFGVLFSLKFQERYACHRKRAYALRDRLDTLQPELKFSQIEDSSDAKHRKSSPVLSRVSLRYFWIVLHLVITGIGVVLLIQCFQNC